MRRHIRCALLPLTLLAALPAAHAAEPASQAACPPPPDTSPASYRAEAARPHPDQGVLWELRKNGQVGYLMGSIHIGQLPWVFPGPRTAAALREASAVALELNPLDPATQQTLAQAMRHDSASQRRIMRRHPELVARMDALAKTQCIDRQQWDALGTTARLMVLSLNDMASQGYQAAYGIDVHLALAAQATHKPIEAIETAQEQLTAMGLSDNAQTPATTPDDIRKALDDIDSHRNRDTTTALVRYWQQGDLASLNQWMHDCQCLDDLGMKSALLDARNQRMAKRIPDLLAAHPHLFIAVGMLHMVGEHSLLQLLQAQGYAVRQLTGLGATANHR